MENINKKVSLISFKDIKKMSVSEMEKHYEKYPDDFFILDEQETNLLFNEKDPEKVDFLLKIGLDPDIVSPYGMQETALMSNIKNKEVFFLIADATKNINAVDVEGKNILHHLVEAFNLKDENSKAALDLIMLFEYALIKGVNPNHKEYTSNSSALLNANKEMSKLLIEYGGDAHETFDYLTGVYNKKSLPILLEKGCKWSFELFEDNGGDIFIEASNGKNALFYVENVEALSYLLEKGLDINKKDKDGNLFLKSVLTRLVFPRNEIKDKILFNLLDKYGFDYNNVNNENKSIICHLDFYIKEFIDKGVNPNKAAGNEPNILFLSGRNLRDEDFATILEHIDDLSVKNKEGEDLLSVCFDSLYRVKLLISKGADVNIVNDKGENILFYADIDVAEYLLNNTDIDYNSENIDDMKPDEVNIIPEVIDLIRAKRAKDEKAIIHKSIYIEKYDEANKPKKRI